MVNHELITLLTTKSSTSMPRYAAVVMAYRSDSSGTKYGLVIEIERHGQEGHIGCCHDGGGLAFRAVG